MNAMMSTRTLIALASGAALASAGLGITWGVLRPVLVLRAPREEKTLPESNTLTNEGVVIGASAHQRTNGRIKC